MANPVLTLDYANLFCGSGAGDGAAGNHLTLADVKLPSIEVQYVDHRPGGAPIATEIDVIVTKLEAEFTLIGITPQVMEKVRPMLRSQTTFFIYGLLRDQMSGGSAQAMAQITGRLGHVDPQAWHKGVPMHISYAIRGITSYYLEIAGRPLYHWDFFDNKFAVGGIDQNATPW